MSLSSAPPPPRRYDSSDKTVRMTREEIDKALSSAPPPPNDEEVTCPGCKGKGCTTCRDSGKVTPATFAEFWARNDAP